MSNTVLVTIIDWVNLGSWSAILHITPGFIAGVILLLVSWRLKKVVAALPCTLVIIPCTFYIYLAVSGYTLSEARTDGWVAEASEPVPMSQVWRYFMTPDKIHWSYMPG